MIGSPLAMTRAAASATVGSRHPPDSAHSYVPFRRTNIRVPSRRYALPLIRTTVAIAAGSPAARAWRIASRSRSVSRRSIEPRWHNPEDPATATYLLSRPRTAAGRLAWRANDFRKLEIVVLRHEL